MSSTVMPQSETMGRRVECSKVQSSIPTTPPLTADHRCPSSLSDTRGNTMTPSTPAFYILFCVAIVLVLKEVNSVVWEPYMVSRHLNSSARVCDGTLLRLLPRTNRSTSRRARRIVEANGQRGIQKSRHRRVCEFLA